MKQEIQDKALEIITQIQGAVQSGANWTLEQLPDIAYQFILFNRIWLPIETLLCLGLLYVSWKLFEMGWKENMKGILQQHLGKAILAPVLGGGGLLIFGVAFTLTLRETFFVWFAPKVFLLTELVKLFK